MARLNYIQGITSWNAKKILKYLFPNDFHNLTVNEREMTFDVTLFEPKTNQEKQEVQEEINDFQAYWGKQYRFFWR